MTELPKKSLFILFIVVATELIGFGLIIPVLPQLATQFNVSSFYLGILMAAYSAAQFVAAPFLGALSDRYGRRPILLLSKLGTIFGYGVLAVSHSYSLFLLSRIIDGFTGGNISIARAYVADVTTPENRPKGMAVIGIAFGVGFILGPALGGFLYSFANGQTIAALTAGGFSLLAFILTYFLLEEPPHRKVTESTFSLLKTGFKAFGSPIVQCICLAQLLFMLAFSGFETSFSVFTQHKFGFNTVQNSWLFVYAGLMTLVVQGYITRKKTAQPKKMVLMGLVLTACGFSSLAASQQLVTLCIGIGLMALGMGIVSAYLPSLLSTSTPQEHQGSILGFYEGIGSISRVFGPLAAFSLFSVSPSFCYTLYAVTLAAIALLFSFLPKNNEPTTHP
jgi:DHA1 family tetracycline resistance protein-like MFS transporter